MDKESIRGSVKAVWTAFLLSWIIAIMIVVCGALLRRHTLQGLFVYYVWQLPPRPGVAIALLALVAAIVSLVTEKPLSGPWRAALIGLFCILCLCEIGAVNHYGEQADTERQSDEETRNNQFEYTKEQLADMKYEINYTGDQAQLAAENTVSTQQTLKGLAASKTKTISASNLPTSAAPNPTSVTPTAAIPVLPVSQDLQLLQQRALQEAKDIYEWVSLASKNAPNLPNMTDEIKAQIAYGESLRSDWNARFLGPAASLFNETHASFVGIQNPCGGGNTDDASFILMVHKHCAEVLEQAAMKLR